MLAARNSEKLIAVRYAVSFVTIYYKYLFLYMLGTPRPGATFRETLAYLGGPWGLFRGVWPGTLCGALRNGCAMVMMVQAQGWATKLGLRQKQ